MRLLGWGVVVAGVLHRSGPQALGPSRPCPAREGQWNSLRSGLGDVAVGRDSTSIIDTMFRLASRLCQMLYNETRNANS